MRQPVDFLVLFSGPAVPGREILVDQAVRMTRAQGAPEVRIDSLRRIQDRLLTAVIEAPDSAAAAQAARTQLEQIGVDSTSIAAQVRSLTSPWMRRFLTLDPAPLLREVEVPVLALYGGKDVQVSDELNADRMGELLGVENDPEAQVRIFENVNHLFQPAQTGLPTEYGQIETTIDPAVLEAIAAFIREVRSGQ
jgi:pimeloyl-ACP methyl ester carboxylesterase